jgi:transcriptional regulator with XRE-family HTH domain
MVRKVSIHLSTHAQRTVQTLAAMIAAARRERKMSQKELAERLGVSRPTVRSIETGSPTVSVGTVFEAALIVGIPLLAENRHELNQLATSIAAISRVLPERARRKQRVMDDEF